VCVLFRLFSERNKTKSGKDDEEEEEEDTGFV
jgi:hypothetical protein